MMKKLFALLLSICMIVPMCLAEAVPAPDDALHGFIILDSREFPLYNAVVYRYVHERTGAEVIHIDCDDTNRMFNISFHTQAIDNTGLPHVFEHAVINGSDKYPSRDLFMSLFYGSYNTYMNAHTGQNCTYYPVGSLSEDQLLRFADLYVDCCLHPTILKDEAIYRSEAWRYRMASPEDELTIEGTVYSEMLGALTLQRANIYNVCRTALPGSMVGNVSGGDPDFIPDMTYDMLRDYHAKYYHPSNSVTWLYGRLDKLGDFLALLDDAFAPFDRQAFTLEDPGYTPITGPVEAEYAFPVEAGSDTDDAAMCWYSFVCPGLKGDADESQAVKLLSILLNDDSSPIGLAMRRELPSAGFGCTTYTEGPDPLIVFVAQNIDREDVPTFKRIVEEGIADAVANGFSDDLVDAVAASEEIANRMTTENASIGYYLISGMMQEYFTFGDPYRLIDDYAAIDSLKPWHASGRFCEMAKKWLQDNSLTAIVTTWPDPGKKEEKDAALAEKLREIKANMSAEEIDAIVASSNAQPEYNPDTAAMVRDLTAVTVPTLPEEALIFPVRDVTDESGIRHMSAVAEVEDIANVKLLLDTSAMPQENLLWMQLYVDLLGEIDTAGHTWDQLPLLESRYLYNFNLNLYSKVIDEPFTPKLQIEWIGLDGDQATAFDLVHELMFDTKFDDPELLSDNLAYLIASARQGINADPGSLVARRAIGRKQLNYRYADYLKGLSYYNFLNDTAALLENDPAAVQAKLEGVQATLNNSTNAIVEVVGSADSIELNDQLADEWFARLDHRPIEPVTYDLPVPAQNEALIVDSAVQYNFVALDKESLGLEPYDPLASVVSTLINDTYLIPMIRDQYGAYSTSLAFSNLGAYIDTYRDPNIAQSFETIDGLPDFMDSLPEALDQETLDPYIMSVYTGYAQSSGQLSEAMNALTSYGQGYPDDFKLQCMRNLEATTPETLAEYAPAVRRLVEEGARYTAGGAAAINAEADRYDVILNPFGSAQ